NLGRRSLADRDSLSVSLRGLCAARSSGQQAPGPHAAAVSLSLPLPSTGDDSLPHAGGRPVMSRRRFIAGVVLAVTPLGATASAQEYRAQQSPKVWRIGFLSPFSADLSKAWQVSLQQGLQQLGYVEGKNVVIEQRHADGRLERLADLAHELVRLQIDVVVVHGLSNAIQAARNASSTIPIVFVANPDPVGTGVVASLARPGENVTGLSDLHSEIVGKRLELLKEFLPFASRIAVMVNPEVSALVQQMRDA